MPENLDGRRGLKRHDALAPLSRDHHYALIHSLAMRRASEAPPGEGRGAVATAESFLSFYEEELLGHMADEEEALVPLAGDAAPEDTARLLSEHEGIREGAALLRQALEEGTDPRELMKELGERLHDHVRFEERSYFETVQLRLSDERLVAVGHAIDEHRRCRNRGDACYVLPAGFILPARKG
jgi:hypothetical protein